MRGQRDIRPGILIMDGDIHHFWESFHFASIHALLSASFSCLPIRLSVGTQESLFTPKNMTTTTMMMMALFAEISDDFSFYQIFMGSTIINMLLQASILSCNFPDLVSFWKEEGTTRRWSACSSGRADVTPKSSYPGSSRLSKKRIGENLRWEEEHLWSHYEAHGRVISRWQVTCSHSVKSFRD